MELSASERVSTGEQPGKSPALVKLTNAAPEAVTHPLRVVHLPVYHDNAYQPMLMEAQAAQGLYVIDGGGGGNFLRTALREWRPDIVHVHWLHPYLLRPSLLGSWARGLRFLAEVRLLRNRGAAIVWTVHNLSNHAQLHSRTELVLSRRFARLCDAVVTHGRAASILARTRFQISSDIPVYEVPFPHYTGRYPNTSDRKSARGRLGIRDRTFVVTFLGRVEPYKQVLELIHAFRKTAPQDSCLLVAGRSSDPGYSAQLRDAAAGDERIRLELKFVADTDVQYYLNAADIVACPSSGILTSSSVLLALSFARPVVAPAEGCIPESVGEAGVLYRQDGTPGLADALVKVFGKRELLPQLGTTGLQRVQGASPASVAGKLVIAYRRCLKR